MLLCDCCDLPMSVCECWLVYLDEQRDNYEDDWPYRYDPAYTIEPWEDYDELDQWLVNAAESWRRATNAI